jgi:glycosyltransferase involved in cell wall biosynthesis
LKRAKLIHVDLNSGGGSERLALTTLETLKESGYVVDIVTFSYPQWHKIKNTYGLNQINENVREIEVVDDIGSLLDSCFTDKSSEDKKYQLIINTHGDLLPYYKPSEYLSGSTKVITYCHYPVLPSLIAQRKYNFFRLTSKRKFGHLSESDRSMDSVALRALDVYNQMIKGTTLLTNSYFSQRAIKSLYADVEPAVLSPPVDVQTFRSVLQRFPRQDRIVVLSRYSPDKKIELALEIARTLKNLQFSFEMIVVGTLSKDEFEYYYRIGELIRKYELGRLVKLKVNVELSELLNILGTSKILLHPTFKEPFGIAVAEGMSSGLVPVVPTIGGNSEFVPRHLQFRNTNQAAEIIVDVMGSEQELRIKLSRSMDEFSKFKFKSKLTGILETQPQLAPNSILEPSALAAI